MISEEQIHTITGGNVMDSEGNKIGSVGQIYLDDQTGNAAWVTVKTGLFGNSESFVPLQDAEVDGDGVKVPFTKDKVKDAPRVDADKHLDHDEERKLYEYYGVDYDTPAAAPVAGREGDARPQTDHDGHDGHDHAEHDHDGHDHAGHDHDHDRAGTGHDYEDTERRDNVGEDRRDRTDEAGVVGHDTSRAATDEPMTRSEEPARVRTDEVEAAGPRLRKFLVTEQVTITVPVTHEELRMVDESDGSDDNGGDRAREGDQRH